MKYTACPKEKNREREIGAGRHFKLNKRDRFVMLLGVLRLNNLHVSWISL